MSDLPRSRKRAVRLTPEALVAFKSATAKRWQEHGRGDKLTREFRAGLWGVSVATAGRILSGGGVDRATLALAHKNLDLAWDDSLCEPLPQETEPTSVTHPELAPDPAPAVRSEESSSRRRAFRTAFLCLGIAATAWAALSLRSGLAERSWGATFNDAFEEGLARFHRADYAGAHVPLERALAIAREHDSAAKLASALRLAGDLAGAQGRLPESKGYYEEALLLHDHLAQEVAKPAIYEALGDVETRLGNDKGANDSLNRSLEGYRRFDDRTGMAMASRDLGALALRQGDLDAADRWFVKSLDALGGLSKPDIVCDVRGQRALVLLGRGRTTAARDALRSCLAYWTEKGHVRWIAVCELRLGLAEAQLGHPAGASALFSRSREGFLRVGDRAGALDAASRLRRLAARTKRRSA